MLYRCAALISSQIHTKRVHGFSHQPSALCNRISRHSSSSSSILVSSVGTLPSELPLSFVPDNAAPRLLRTLSSNPGRLARCFLKGLATSGSGRFNFTVVAADDEGSAVVSAGWGAGVPDIGLPDAPRLAGDAVRFRGSAECCRLS